MRIITVRLIAALCGVMFLVGCSTAKKSKVLQSNTAVITPSVIVENSAPMLGTINIAAEGIEQAKVGPSLAVNTELTPEQQAWNMFMQGTSKQYDFGSAIHFDVRKPSFVRIHHTSQ